MRQIQMPAIFYRSLHKIIIILLIILLPSFVAIAQIDIIKKEAKIYRDKGYEAQVKGDLDLAMSYYQKAIELDPEYAAAHNDLGVIYEIKGFKDRAEDSYLRCIQIDPYYQSAYSNLANFYEQQGNLRKAADFWKRRIEIGDPNDLWTQKARTRLNNIGMLISDIGLESQHYGTVDWIKRYSRDRDYLEGKTSAKITERKDKARGFFERARANYLKGNYTTALRDASTARFFDPSNTEIEKFIDKIRGKLSAYSQ